MLNGHAPTSIPFPTYSRIEALRNDKGKVVSIDGHTLSMADVIAVAQHGVKVELSDSAAPRVEASVAFLESRKHLSLYGITTGFGGSADTRTGDTQALQVSLLEHQLCGFLPRSGSWDDMTLHAMPRHIIKGAMVIRVNSLARGHSGVRWKVLKALVDFINIGLVPCVPLRGSISASGDLSPLSYIAASICGHPDVKVFDTASSTVLAAPEAIAKYNLEKITLAAKEGLGLVNGTAVSCSAATLALYQAETLAALTQTVTAMTVEAMIGQVASFDEFIHDVTRPHAGQVEAARNVRAMLSGSKLAIHEEGEVAIVDDVGILRQDRYALRTSPQWIGPQLESLGLARQQVEAELNSTTDNPLIDVEKERFLHGGNFQAMALTQAMDATRQVLQNLGRLSFAQLTELVNCTMNRGLPGNLAGDEPSTNYHCKGLDIHSAAYTSELGFLANPVSSHVQSTEMHNQSVNSLALISARKTLEANDVLSLLLSSHLYCVTQAIDLRLMDVKFQVAVKDLLTGLLSKHYGSYLDKNKLSILDRTLSIAMFKRLEDTTSWDSPARFEDLGKHLVGPIVDSLVSSQANGEALGAISAWKADFTAAALELYRCLRKDMHEGGKNVQEAKENMGRTFAVYDCVRTELGVGCRRGDVADGKMGKSIGANVSTIVEAVRDGRLVEAVGRMLSAQ